KIKHLVAGFDYSFGFKGKGNMDNIGGFTRDAFTYTSIDKVEKDAEKISSTRIRNLLRTGDVAEAERLLGRPFTVSGTVIEGDKRGKELGYPTANLSIHDDVLLPQPGIYAVKVIYKEEYLEGMASLGTNPTFSGDQQPGLSLEVNILDYNHDLYGEELQVEWCKYIREEIKFDHVDDLIMQMKNDEQEIRAFFAGKVK